MFVTVSHSMLSLPTGPADVPAMAGSVPDWIFESPGSPGPASSCRTRRHAGGAAEALSSSSSTLRTPSAASKRLAQRSAMRTRDGVVAGRPATARGTWGGGVGIAGSGSSCRTPCRRPRSSRPTNVSPPSSLSRLPTTHRQPWNTGQLGHGSSLHPSRALRTTRRGARGAPGDAEGGALCVAGRFDALRPPRVLSRDAFR
ncbi:hypothetical protein PsYK624_125710 [Phanerochaete sordida]|uniref:Uncharacterized protein n=1 Tax=Phanerochaete sordida TaxID=48140 RepID=A0A9P3GKD0_9APHY|nr:hypothetical protein PsYK624_125710 [Phanerochaete sordida]